MCKQFYLTSRHGDCGNNVMFHRKNRRGYTTNLDDAHLFTKEEAEKALSQDVKSLPLEKEAVDNSAILGVDHQYLDKKGKPTSPDENCLIQKNGEYNGNDICFFTRIGLTFDYSIARREGNILKFSEIGEFDPSECTVWSVSYLDTIARRTLQREDVNTRRMTTEHGIKYKKPRKQKPTTGKNRFNCPSCGKIVWEHQHFENDVYCSTECERGYI